MPSLIDNLVKCSSGGGWFIPEMCVGRKRFEVTVAGNGSGPELAALDLANLHAFHIPQYFAAAVVYLGAFIKPEHFQSAGEWELLGVEFGFPPFPAPDFFSLHIGLPDDTYGLWHVAFTAMGTPQPISFGRRAW